MRDEIRLYYDKKNKCPRCHSKNLAKTDINILDLPVGKYIDNRNKTACLECNWYGVIDKLIK